MNIETDNNPLKTKSINFSVRIVNLYKFLLREKNESIMSKQILRSGTSVGANISESVESVSRPDFANKLSIAYKEASETNYWLELLFKTEFIDLKLYQSMKCDCDSISKLLFTSIKTTRENYKN